ncbi:MAG: hypothetical protein IJ762_00015 [Bacteroidaceae bacterium]|nr:hypothetical protein [Bacteroidaceae bacterium]
MTITIKKLLHTRTLLAALAALPWQGDSSALATVTEDDLSARFERHFRLMDSLILSTDTVVTEPRQESVSVQAPTEYVNNGHWARVDSLVERRVKAETAAIKSVTGLNLHGQTYYRLDEGFGLDEDDALSRYKGKIQAEVRWNFLQSSLINRKGKTHEVVLKGEIDKIRYKKEDVGMLVASQKVDFLELYDMKLSSVLQHRICNLSLLSSAQEYLLRSGHISSDELLKILNEKAEAERIYATIAHKAPPATDLSRPEAIVVKVDTARLMEFVKLHNSELGTLELRRQLLEQQRLNKTYWSTLNVSPFLRYSYYTRPKVNNSSNIDAGVSFIVPLTGEVGKKRRVLKAEQDMLGLENEQLSERIVAGMKLLTEEVERMNRASIGELRRLEELLLYLRSRQTAYANRIGEYSMLARIKEYNIYLLCWERLLGYQYQRDCHLASLQAYLADTSIMDFCTEVTISGKEAGKQPPEQETTE